MGFYKRFGILALAAILQIISLASSNLYWLVFVFAVPLFFFLKKEKRLYWALLGFSLYRFFAMTGVAYFVFDPIMFVASVAIFLGFPLSFWLVKKFWSERGAFLLAPFFWTFWDYVSARYTALPNFVMAAGNALGNSPFLGLAGVWGIVSLTFFALLLNLLIFLALQNLIQNPRGDMKITAISAAGIITILLAGWLTSLTVLWDNRKNYELRPGRAKVVLVSQKNGWDDDFANKNLSPAEAERLIAERFYDLKSRLAQMDFDFLVLPEAMIDLKPSSEATALLTAAYGNLARDLGKNLAANATLIQNDKRRNTLLFFADSGDLVDVFYKKYLAITGEYWPFGNWRPFYFNWLLKIEPGKYDDYAIFNPKNSFAPGETKVVRVKLPSGNLALAPSICIEIHYPAEMRRRVNLGASAILNTSSNLWAPLWGLDRYLTLTNNLRRIEAVWLKTPILVNGRREPPAIILPDGEVTYPDSGTETGDYQILAVKLKFH
jgi:apolipoprotein N-acyltransferase